MTKNLGFVNASLDFEVPVWSISLFASTLVFVVLIMKFRSESYTPQPLGFFLFLSVVGCLFWVNFLLGMILDVLELIQTTSGLPDLVLGMTIMAIGNSCTGTSR